jgi:TPR repeat protein
MALLVPALPVQAEGTFLRFLQQTAEHGEAESQFILGLAYRDGWEGSIQPGSTAAKWCELAVELGDQRPALVLGLLQKEQDRVTKNASEAMKWLRLAAEHGDNYARVIWGDMLLEGDGVPADWCSGTAWIRKSAIAGFAPAQFRLGVIYLVGDETTPKNEVESLAWFIVASKSGSKSAQEYRDAQTRVLGREVARLAVLRSRTLLVKGNQPAELAGL